MATNQRENSHVVRLGAYRGGVCEQRSAWSFISRRISSSWCRTLRSLYRFMGGQKSKVRISGDEMNISKTIHDLREPVEIHLTLHSKMRKWAAENAYMLVLMATLFVITWVWIFLTGVRHFAG